MNKVVVHALLEDAAYQHSTVPVTSGTHTFDYAQVYRRSVRLANCLESLGVRPGCVVGVMDINSHRYLELKYALSMLGAIIHPINFRLSPQDVLFTMQHAQDEWLFIWDGFGELGATISKSIPHTVWMSDITVHEGGLEYESLIDEGKFQMPRAASHVRPEDIYSIFYTTGTTGQPKGLRYSHQQMLMGSLQIAHHLALHDTGATLSAQDVMMPLIPFFHIHGWGTPFVAPYLGTPLILPERSNALEQISLIQRHGVTWINMVPTQLFMLLEAAQSAGVQDLPLKILTGGSPLAMGLARRAAQFHMTFSMIYGGSDQLGSAISTAAGLTGDDRIKQLSTHMMPFPMVRMEVRTATGDLVNADGQSLGELWVQSPWLPDGYVDNPEQSQQTYINGWFRSGDLAIRYPDGSISVVDRMRDAIKSGGEWIASSTIESILSEVPGVKSVAVIAVPDAQWGERPKAIVEASPSVTESILQEFLRQAVKQGQLAKFAVPDVFQFIHQMPVTSAGKINKAALRTQ
ncbi:AMP-binding protein [Sulfobacillus sp. hq2]|uniref:AMP-binding protein n=2 Tax=Sulfobacillus TaxID=28033 RepID=UPI000CD1A375|nr:AMP-binding protein [Sulfobacillus sp. hq2]POB11042.1 AMP-dependent synthetase [Sulfobacillus sp. hq2]